jgi:hypothetical protein
MFLGISENVEWSVLRKKENVVTLRKLEFLNRRKRGKA